MLSGEAVEDAATLSFGEGFGKDFGEGGTFSAAQRSLDTWLLLTNPPLGALFYYWQRRTT